jgi:hypothetical protein
MERILASATIIAGVGAHALSCPPGARLAVAATTCWLALGATVLACARDRAQVLAWIDACLVTMRHGTAVLVLGAFLNAACALAGRSVPAAQLAVVFAADVRMLATFVRHAPLPADRAAALWVLGMNGLLGVLLWI